MSPFTCIYFHFDDYVELQMLLGLFQIVYIDLVA